MFYTAGVIACQLNNCTYMYIWHITSLLLSETLSIAHDYIHGEPFALQEENFHWNSNFAISLITNSLKLNSAYRYNIIFKNLTMIAYMIEIQKSKFANISFCEFNQSEPGR